MRASVTKSAVASAAVAAGTDADVASAVNGPAVATTGADHPRTDARDARDAPVPAASAHPLSLRLHRLSDRVAEFDRRRPRAWDLTVTLAWLAAACIDVAGGGWRNITLAPGTPQPLLWTISLAFTLPLLWRRTHPVTVLLVTLPAALANSWSGAVLQAAYLQLIPLFHIALRRGVRLWLVALALVSLPLLAGTVHRHPEVWDQQFVPTLNAFVVVGLLGIAVRSRKDRTAALLERARRLEMERDRQMELAAAAERARIAREMHDIIGHNLSVITTLADGGSYAAARSPQRAAQALEAIGDTSRQALTELRSLLGVLRADAEPVDAEPLDAAPADPVPVDAVRVDPVRGDAARVDAPRLDAPRVDAQPATVRDGSGMSAGADGPAPLSPQPSLAELPRLLDGVRRAGLPVELRTDGDLGALTAGQQLVVHRIVQESLTNTLKHAGNGASAVVSLHHATTGEVTVRVTDSGGRRAEHSARHDPDRWAGNSGRGLTGMRERAAHYNGSLRAGPQTDSGWEVHLRLPVPPGGPVAPGTAATSPASTRPPVSTTPEPLTPGPAASGPVASGPVTPRSVASHRVAGQHREGS